MSLRGDDRGPSCPEHVRGRAPGVADAERLPQVGVGDVGVDRVHVVREVDRLAPVVVQGDVEVLGRTSAFRRSRGPPGRTPGDRWPSWRPLRSGTAPPGPAPRGRAQSRAPPAPRCGCGGRQFGRRRAGCRSAASVSRPRCSLRRAVTAGARRASIPSRGRSGCRPRDDASVGLRWLAAGHRSAGAHRWAHTRACNTAGFRPPGGGSGPPSRLAERNLISAPDRPGRISGCEAPTVSLRAMIAAVERAGFMVRDLRTAFGWSQRTLAARAGVSQSWLCAFERGRYPDVPIGTVEKVLAAMGARLLIDVSVPFQASPRQRDLVHAKCTTHVARRLERAGWSVATEVEIGDGGSRGWISPCRPGIRLLACCS